MRLDPNKTIMTVVGVDKGLHEVTDENGSIRDKNTGNQISFWEKKLITVEEVSPEETMKIAKEQTVSSGQQYKICNK